MTAYLNDTILDNGLAYLKTNADKLYVNFTQQPATYTEATSTYACGNKNWGAGNVIPGALAAGSPSGRKATTAAITDGSITATQTAGWWSIVYSGGSALLAANSLSATQAVTNGNSFSLAAFDIRLPNTGG